MKNLVPFRHQSLGRIFDELINQPLLSTTLFDTNTFKIDVINQDNKYLVEAELPGIDKSEVKVLIDNGTLTINIERSLEDEKSEENYLHRERHFASMSRSLYLKDASNDDVTAKLEDGILKIIINKILNDRIVKEINIE